MPKMDGAELALRIKSDRPELPVLMFTGYPADVPEDVRRSVDAFVVKGDPAEKLLQTIRDLVPSNGDQVRRVKRNGRSAAAGRRLRRPA
jgi:CheY-like chemotaxis protein